MELKSYKIVCHLKNLSDVFIQKLPSNIYKLCSIKFLQLNGFKIAVQSLSDSCWGFYVM